MRPLRWERAALCIYSYVRLLLTNMNVTVSKMTYTIEQNKLEERKGNERTGSYKLFMSMPLLHRGAV